LSENIRLRVLVESKDPSNNIWVNQLNCANLFYAAKNSKEVSGMSLNSFQTFSKSVLKTLQGLIIISAFTATEPPSLPGASV